MNSTPPSRIFFHVVLMYLKLITIKSGFTDDCICIISVLLQDFIQIIVISDIIENKHRIQTYT